MKKRNLRERLRYFLERLLSQKPFSMILLLFSFMITVVLAIGTVAFFVSDDGGWLYQLWTSLMHTLDAGTLAGNSTENVPYLVMMSLATLCGLLLTSVLIGIITTGFETKLENLKKGSSAVQVQGQTTIIGFDDNVYSLISELVEANRNKKKAHVVVLGNASKEEMEDAIAAHVPKTYTTQIVCRSGQLYEPHSLQLCAVENSRSVIVNTTDDAETVKVLLALSAYVKGVRLYNPELCYVASIRSEENIEVARIAGEGRARIVYTSDAVARIIVNTCRQHGLARVLTELFDFSGDEMYIERVPELVGKTFGEAMSCLENATLIGLSSKAGGRLNPPMDTVITEEDGLVMIERDDGDYRLCRPQDADADAINTAVFSQNAEKGDLVILGSNDKLSIILSEYDKYVAPGTSVTVVDEELSNTLAQNYRNLSVSVCERPINKAFLEELAKSGTANILLLNDDSAGTQQSDANTLIRLLLLRNIADNTDRRFSITTEMHHAENQKLAARARVDDFVIGSNFSRLLMAQISECPALSPIIDDLLDEDGSELYIKPADHYVKTGVPVSMFTLVRSAAQKGEILLGYRITRDGVTESVLNPVKSTLAVFGEEDRVIVIADN